LQESPIVTSHSQHTSEKTTDKESVSFLHALIAEHQAMISALKTLESNIESKNLLQAQDLFQGILNEMRVHFACEEQVLFPMVHPYRTMVLMEVEHDEIFARRDALQNVLDDSLSSQTDWETIKKAFDRFSEYLTTHIHEEDTGVFPFCTKVLSDYEKQRVAEGMAVLRKKDETHPLPPIERAEGRFDHFPVQAHDWESQTRPIQIQLLAKGDTFEIKQLFFKTEASLASHWTPHPLTLICQTGQLLFESQDKQVILNPGDAVTLSPRLYHAVSALENSQVLQLFQILTPDRFWLGLNKQGLNLE
jgi:hemerythrin-like domain-containing protein/quercetin dioxygenase-like cupin family protein